MAYKKVKLLDESGNEELYPETDWSIIKNSPVTTDSGRIMVNNKGNISFAWNENASINAGGRITADNVSLQGENLYISDKNTENKPILFEHYPRTEKVLEDCPLSLFFGVAVYRDDYLYGDKNAIFPAVAIGQMKSDGKIIYYVFCHKGDTPGEWWRMVNNQMRFIPINKTS